MKALVINAVRHEPNILEVGGKKYDLQKTMTVIDTVSNKMPEGLSVLEQVYFILSAMMNDYLESIQEEPSVDYRSLMRSIPVEQANDVIALVNSVMYGEKAEPNGIDDPELDALIDKEVENDPQEQEKN